MAEVDWLSVYANPLKRTIERNQNFLKTEATDLLKAIEEYLELWVKLSDIISKTGKSGYTVMWFAVNYLWFPSRVFSLVFNVLSSNIAGAFEALRFAMEAIEIGVIGDCCPEFQKINFEKKIDILNEIRPKEIISRIKQILNSAGANTLCNRLIGFYNCCSQLMHSTSFGRKLVEMFRVRGDLPSMALYYPDLSEIEPEILEELVNMIEQFCEMAEELISIWEKCCNQ